MHAAGIVDVPVLVLRLLWLIGVPEQLDLPLPEVSRIQPMASSARQVPSSMSTFTGWWLMWT